MPVITSQYLEAIAALPLGGTLRIDDVPWEAYEQLLSDLGEGYSVRIHYDSGRMEIMAPAYPHEKAKQIISRLVQCLSDELDIDIESAGSTTWKSRMKRKGVEPDDCFYVQNAARIIGKQNIDLKRDPPPDLVLEVESTTASLSKFPIYSALEVPEFWRIVKEDVLIYVLAGKEYQGAETSRAFPFLSGPIISEFLKIGLAEGERKASQAFRNWIRKNVTLK